MPPLKLTDEEMTAVFQAARPIPVDRRDAFLEEVAALLRGCIEVGPGTVHRAIAQAQRLYFDAPETESGRPGVSRWARKDGGIRRVPAET